MAVEIRPHFQSGRSGGLVGVAKPHYWVIGVLLGLYTKLEPNGLSYLKDTACFMKGGGAGGLVGVAKLHPNFSYIEVGLHAKFQLTGPNKY